ncbi:M14 family metallopeptidase [Porcipelethomonas sp.]|uniref:M14 family metallopeptidase n=1 Tax=Porcipelethomonas sp. TaxID=2981675 RepID=UPI003EF82E9D
MVKDIIYSLKSPYRESLDVTGFRFGSGKKSIAVIGAFRGNEIQQMYVCSQLVQKLKFLEENGQIVKGHEILVVPCVNYYSMNIGKRFWAMDNTDINRMFPGYNLGETTQRIADGVFNGIQGYEYGIQMASFYQEGNFLPHVKIMETGFTDKELMKLFGFQYGIVRKPRPYDTTTLNYNWQIWETKAFSVYTNATDYIDEESAQEAVTAILRFMSNTGIINKKIRKYYDTEIVLESSISQIRSDCSGIFRSALKIGSHVDAGDILGEILNPLDGTINSKIKSEFSGEVYFKYNRPLINEKTVCFKIICD